MPEIAGPDIASGAATGPRQMMQADQLELDGGMLRDALAGRRWAFLDQGVRNECFILGARCARAGAQMPDWLSSAPLWAEAAALEGYRAWFARIAPGGRGA